MASDSGVMPSQEQSSTWCARVHQTQCQRMSPEERQALANRVESSRQHEENMRRCHAVRCHAERTSALNSEGLRQMAVCSAPAQFTAVQQRWMSAQSESEGLQTAALDQLRRGSAVVLGRTEELRNQCLAQVTALSGAADATAVAADAARAGNTGDAAVLDLLKQLKNEPRETQECAAKFMLYETFFAQVEKLRADLFGFYQESSASVPPAVAAEMLRQMKGIDSEQAMGIPDDRHTWFVYHMMRQASKNNDTMAVILHGFEKKLEVLANQTETDCPVCLEPFTPSGDHAAETLGCCHKVCKECWLNWTQVMNGNPFCPLCRHDAFVNVVARRAQHQ